MKYALQTLLLACEVLGIILLIFALLSRTYTQGNRFYSLNFHKREHLLFDIDFVVWAVLTLLEAL